MIFIGIFFASAYQNNNTTQTTSDNQEVITETIETKFDKELKVYIFDVSQGDAILLEYDRKFMLIDAGKNSDEERMVEYLKKLNVNKLDHVVASHGHADHVGGMDSIIYKFPIDNFYMTTHEADTKTYRDVVTALTEKKVNVIYPDDDIIIKENNLEIEMFTPKISYSNLNNNSIVVKINYGSFDMLFAGDMEKEQEKSFLESELATDIDVLKVGHHGSKTSTTEELLKEVKPEYAIISVGENNKYGHPNKEIINRLEQNQTEIYRTDKNGNILIESNGEDIKVLSEK